MKYVNSGNGKVPLMSLIAILSISLAVNLPGLAISPIMDKLDQVFHHVTELEVQLLTVLPNLVTIPFILCAGKICTPKNQIFVLGLGLVIYTVTGVLYFFATSMTQLIILSCVLGMGCGLIIPLAASLISQYFSGKQRTKELGMKSSLSNFSIIFATIYVGWMASIDWHLAFTVYLIPIIPLILIPFMTNRYVQKHSIINAAPPAGAVNGTASKTVSDSATTPEKTSAQASSSTPAAAPSSTPLYSGKKALMILFGIMTLYFLVTYASEVVSYYLPFSMAHYHLSTDAVGIVTSGYFAAITIAGFFLTRILSVLKEKAVIVALVLCIAGLLISGCLHSYFTFFAGIFILGIGYGIIQPVLYDKISNIAPTSAKSTAYFSYLLACNYVGISVVPFIIGGAEHLFKAEHSINFSFYFNAAVLVVLLVVAIFKRHSFVFEAQESK